MDLRGLEADIHKRIADGISEECDFIFDISALKNGYFSFGDLVLYIGKVSAVGNHPATTLVTCIKRSFDNNPRIHFHGSDLYLDVKLVEIYTD